MIPAPFAAIESRVNAAVFAHLSNATADLGGGVTVDGIFRAPAADSFGGLVPNDRPTFEAPSASLAAVAVDAALTIGAVAYTVAAVRPDASGTTVLELK